MAKIHVRKLLFLACQDLLFSFVYLIFPIFLVHRFSFPLARIVEILGEVLVL